jgi:hypothetical protein
MAKRRFTEVALDLRDDENDEDVLRPPPRLDAYHRLRSSDAAGDEPRTPPPTVGPIAKRLKNTNFGDSPHFLLPHNGEAKLDSSTTERSRQRGKLETSPSELHKTRRAKKGIESRPPMQGHAVPDTTTKVLLMDSAYDSPASLLGDSNNASGAEELADDFLFRIGGILPRYLCSSPDQNELYRNFLAGCLERYWLELYGETSSVSEKKAYRFFVLHASKLASIIISRSGYPLCELEKWDAVIYDEALVDSSSNLAQVRRFLFDRPPFWSFLERVSTPGRKELVGWYGIGQDDPSSSLMAETNPDLNFLGQSKFNYSTQGVCTKIYQVTFIVRWEIEKYIHEELDSKSSLSDVFTVTGGAKNAYAGTSLDYMKETWPRYGGKLLKMVHELCQSSGPREHFTKIDGHDLEMFFERIGANPYDVEGFAKNENNNGVFSITISGSQAEIIEVAQQLAWITATFRAAVEKRIQFSRSTLSHIEKNCFRLAPAPLSPMAYRCESSSCWHPLLLGSLVVQGFPIPRQTKGIGLEISFDLMVYLAGIRCPVMYKDGIVLKGDEHILVPTSHNPEFTQWHCLSTNSSDRTDLRVISKHCPDTVETTDFETFRQASRIFLGYYRKAKVCLGTRGFQGKNMELSGADFEKGRWRISSLSLQLGFQYFAQCNVVSKVKFSKTLRGTTKEKSVPYDLELKRSRELPLILCDVGTKRDWLVPELSLVLEIARTILFSREDLDDQVLETLPYAKASPDGGLEAFKAIRNGESLILRPQQPNCPPETFMGTVKYVMDALGSRKTKTQESSAGNKIALKNSSILYGWEVKDIIDLRRFWDRRQIPIEVKAAGSWPRDIALSPDILTLFCKDLQDPLSLAADAAACSRWVPFPEGKHYLAASVRCLSKVELSPKSKEAGQKNLQRLRYRTDHKVFDDCDPSTCLGCNRLQDLRAFKRSVDAMDKSTQDAAVILGDPFQYISTKPNQKRQDSNFEEGEKDTEITLGSSSGSSECTKEQHFTSSSLGFGDTIPSSPDTTTSSRELSPRKEALDAYAAWNTPAFGTDPPTPFWMGPSLKQNMLLQGTTPARPRFIAAQPARSWSEDQKTRPDREITSLRDRSTNQPQPRPPRDHDFKAGPFDDSPPGSQGASNNC